MGSCLLTNLHPPRLLQQHLRLLASLLSRFLPPYPTPCPENPFWRLQEEHKGVSHGAPSLRMLIK